LRSNGVIFEVSCDRKCNPQFEALNLKSCLLLKTSGFSLCERSFFGCEEKGDPFDDDAVVSSATLVLWEHCRCLDAAVISARRPRNCQSHDS
jgi:hypothetical protein